jgi:hypothetical protein
MFHVCNNTLHDYVDATEYLRFHITDPTTTTPRG